MKISLLAFCLVALLAIPCFSRENKQNSDSSQSVIESGLSLYSEPPYHYRQTDGIVGCVISSEKTQLGINLPKFNKSFRAFVEMGELYQDNYQYIGIGLNFRKESRSRSPLDLSLSIKTGCSLNDGEIVSGASLSTVVSFGPEYIYQKIDVDVMTNYRSLLSVAISVKMQMLPLIEDQCGNSIVLGGGVRMANQGLSLMCLHIDFASREGTVANLWIGTNQKAPWTKVRSMVAGALIMM